MMKILLLLLSISQMRGYILPNEKIPLIEESEIVGNSRIEKVESILFELLNVLKAS